MDGLTDLRSPDPEGEPAGAGPAEAVWTGPDAEVLTGLQVVWQPAGAGGTGPIGTGGAAPVPAASPAPAGAAAAPGVPVYASVADFLASPPPAGTTAVEIGGTLWHPRAAQPPHLSYKAQDASGTWWSPDAFVVVAAGQSNMLGGGTGGSLALDPDVVAYDWVNDRLIPADYAAAPAGGPGVRTGTVVKNNLFFAFANRAAEELDRPVVVIAHPVSGSAIDSWLASSGVPGSGGNWAVLSAEVSRALALLGQDRIDAFLWHQGEANWQMPQATYEQKFLALVEQVRGQAWGGATLPFLAGELSRQGDRFWQNRAYQAIERSETDPALEFVSSVGLNAFDASGVHFDGASLVTFGHDRYWDAWLRTQAELAAPGSTAVPNAAPALDPGAAPPVALTIAEGQEFRLDLAGLFDDADGDALTYYCHLGRPSVWLARTAGDELVLAPGYAHAGTHQVTVYASDGRLDGTGFTIDLTVTDAAPLVQAYSRRDFLQPLEGYRDLAAADAALGSNRAVDILGQAALPSGQPQVVSTDSLHIRGEAGLGGGLELGTGVVRSYLYGAAAFDVTGNALDNYIVANDGANELSGRDGRDRLYGGDGADRLGGGASDDQLFGGAGADWLDGGAGRDHLWGGTGADRFGFQGGGTVVNMRDISLAEGDAIGIARATGFDDFAAMMVGARIVEASGRVTLTTSAGQMVLWGLTAADVTADLFLFQ